MSNRSASARYALVLCALSLGACSLFSGRDSEPAAESVASAPAPPNAPAAAPTPVAPSAGGAPGAAAVSALQGPVPDRAQQQYSQALQMVKSGRKTDAELEFKQLSSAYPQLAGPQLNLGLLYLKDSRLPEAEGAFKAALKVNPGSTVAGNELGIVERRMGKFSDAESAYQQVILADPSYAPAHLNLGVLYDLYLAQPQKALDEYQRYIEIAGENKQVAGWVIELKKRVGAAPTKKEPA